MSEITIKEASQDSLIAEHFYRLWLDNGVSPDSIDADWQQKTVDFIVEARKNLFFKAYIASIGDRVVASVSCQIFAGLYPMPFVANFRKYGYIWNVYVEPEYRRRGIATKLTKKAIAHLHSLDCTHAILHASIYGKPVYEKLGFVPKNEMILKLD